MAETELKGKEEKLIDSLGPDFDDSEMKKRRTTRIIIISIILVVIIALTVTLVVVLADKEEKKTQPDKEPDKDGPKIIMNDSDFNKPQSTTKSIQLVELKDSKYKFILIHDPKTVNAGLEFRTNFGFNTEVLDGLAHYAEHVFFEGTKASDELEIFNLVGQFDEFLNAYTWEEETVFQILGSNYTFNETLNIVANFIKKPLLNETQFLLEINAVNSEFDTYNYSLEVGLSILRDNANPEHAFYQTDSGHTGNNITLRNVTSAKMKEILRNYFLTIFKPENCYFLVYSSKSFEDMANRAQRYFNFILEEPTKEFNDLIDKKIKALDNPIFLPEQLGKFAVYNNLRETPLLMLTFEFSEKEHYAEIIDFIFYIILNYHEGSFQQYLKMKNYVSSIDISAIGYYKNEEIIGLIFYLTNEGLNNIDKIIEGFFAYVNTIKKEKDEKLEEILNNIKLMLNKNYKFKEDKKTVFPSDIDYFVKNFYLYGKEKILGAPVEELFTLKRAKQIFEELSPDKTFITLDTNITINSKYFEPTTELKYLRNYKNPYRINSISQDLINQLKQVTTVDEYVFKIREINDDYSKLNNMTDIPCYKKETNECNKFNETDINSKEETAPYVVDKSDNILSLMKTDRSFGIPLVKGYIEIELNNAVKNLIKTEDDKAILYLIQFSFFYRYQESSLNEAGNSIFFDYSESDTLKLQITFSTYNDIVDKVINYIINILKEPIDENTFNNLKEKYYLSIANDINSPAVDFRNEMLNLFRRFITIDTYSFVSVPKELIEKVKYEDFNDMFNKISKLFNKIKYLTYGDISFDLANSTTTNLSSILSSQQLLLKLNAIKVPNVPYNSSIYYILKSPNIYQRQGRTLVLFEFDESLRKKMDIFSYCAYNYLFDYIRTKRGSGYAVKTFIQKIFNKSYLVVYVLGKIYSPEKMDRLVNEAIQGAFTYQDCHVDLILKHLKNRENINGYMEDKFNDLLAYLDPQNNFYSENISDEDENMTFESIVEDIQEVFVNKVRRFAILCHRGDESDADYEREKAELDEVYFFNNNVTNEYTEDIDYLNIYVNDL